jgi:serine protease Do
MTTCQLPHRIRDIVIATAFGFILTLAGCQTDSGTSAGLNLAGSPAAGPEYNLFWDQGDHLNDLIEAGKFEEAAKLYKSQRAFFDADIAKYEPQLKHVADNLNRRLAPGLALDADIIDGIAWPAPPSQWSEIKRSIALARKAYGEYDNHLLFTRKEFRSKSADRLKARLGGLVSRLRASAASQFAAFDIFGDVDFFEVYPTTLEPKAMLDRAIESARPRLAAATPKQIESFAGHYTKDRMSPSAWQAVSDLYLGALLRKTSGDRPADLATVLKAVDDARRVGFAPKHVPTLKIGFIEITSRSLLKQGQIEFPAQVDVDLPFESVKTDLDKALDNATANDADYLVVFDVALAKARRRISTKKKYPSRFVAGYRTQPNPDYNMAQTQVTQSQLEMQSAAMQKASINAEFCQGFGCLGKVVSQIAAAAVEEKAREKVKAAMANMQATPMTVDIPVYQNYSYDRAEVHSTKTMTVHYYVVDRRKRRYFKSTFDVVEKKTFKVAYAVNQKDPDRDKIIKNLDSDETVSAWEEAPSTIKLSGLVDHYLKNAKETKPLRSLISLRQEMLKDKNAALAKYEATKFDARPLNDPRFDSVVVIYTKTKDGNALGSGFFVMPDVVLTNFHVVEGATFVEMKTYDGQETFGKVIARDAIRDLALVKVQRRGKPVRFYMKKTLDLGSTVEAIGHPKGLEFSITRGVISAVRKERTALLKGGGTDVLFIQTDAPINPGNSGGPLFLGDRVIGVNTQGMSKSAWEGLNFSIHYSEVLDFLHENLPGFGGAVAG